MREQPIDIVVREQRCLLLEVLGYQAEPLDLMARETLHQGEMRRARYVRRHLVELPCGKGRKMLGEVSPMGSLSAVEMLLTIDIPK
jgi:hypothetical protein